MRHCMLHPVRDTLALPPHQGIEAEATSAERHDRERSQNGVLRTPMLVVHAELPPASAGGLRCAGETSAWIASLHCVELAMTNGTNENVGGETPTDARLFCRGIGHGRAPQRRGAHLSAFHRGSRPKESFIARDSASGQASLGRGGTRFAYPLSGRYPPRPVPKSSVPHAPR